MEKSDYDSLEDWDVVTVSQVSETKATSKGQDEPTEATTVVTDVKNGLKSPSEDESLTSTPEVVPTEPENGTKVVPEQCDEDEPRSESESRESESKASSPEPETQILVEPTDESKSEDVVAAELEVDTKISENIEEEKSRSSENERTSESIPRETVEDIVFDTIEQESTPVDTVPDSCQKPDTQDVLEHLLERISEQDLAAIESSSSDIDIIDEVMDESTLSGSMMSSPLILSISSSVADASYMASSASQFVDIKHFNQEQKDEPKREYMGARQGREKETAFLGSSHGGSDYPPEESSSRTRSERSPRPEQEHSQQRRETPNRRTFYDWLVFLLEIFRSVSPYDWCIFGAMTVAFCGTLIFNQTNIFALVHKDDAMSQMKDMIGELKEDNKILKEQMLSEIKNEKALSSFEHQIKELRKENSRLNHMLIDVAKVLDKQKDFQDKKETEHLLAPFKKEINKLKEYINALKIDNEELQKDMVRMRYSGGQPREGKQEMNEDIPLDVETLKKWNELITLLSKELGILAEVDILKGQKSGKDSFWKNLLNNFKSSYNDFRKVNLSKVFKEFRETKKKEVLNIYLLAKDLVKDFFTPEEIPPADKDDLQWRSVGDFMEDLKEKWANIKDRLYTSDLRKFFESAVGSKKSVDTPSKDHQTTTEQVKIRIKTYNQQGSHSKPDSTGTEEESKWVFERAADREQQREMTKEEEEANWFLKRGKYNSEDEGNKRL